MIYEEVEYDLNYRVKLDIQVQLMAKLPEKEYGKMNVAIEIYFMHDLDEYVDEDNNIDEVLHKAVEEIKTASEGDQDKNSIIGIQALNFELTVIEDIYY